MCDSPLNDAIALILICHVHATISPNKSQRWGWPDADQCDFNVIVFECDTYYYYKCFLNFLFRTYLSIGRAHWHLGLSMEIINWQPVEWSLDSFIFHVPATTFPKLSKGWGWSELTQAGEW